MGSLQFFLKHSLDFVWVDFRELPDIDSNLKVMYNRAILAPGEVEEMTSKKLKQYQR